MPDRRRSAMALMMAASIFALPTSLLASQDSKESTSKTRDRNVQQAQADRLKAARAARQSFLFAGPSRFALMASSRQMSNAAAARQYTEEELREIRASQLRLVRDLSAGPVANPSGTSVFSHPSLGRVVLSNTGTTPRDPKTPGPRVSLPNPAMMFGPSATAGTISSDAQSGGDPGDPGKPGGGGVPGDFPVLVPGSGFSGPTAQPPAVGNEHLRGYDAKAIARWDVVPYQDFDGLFHIGVVAFHMNGIDRVEFSVDGGAWTPVTEMKLNPRTGVWEYTATLDASKFDDGLVEVRARVFPKGAGEVRVLGGDELQVRNGEHSLFLYADASAVMAERVCWVDPVNGSDDNDGLSTSTATRTIDGGLRALQAAHGAIDGGTVYLLEGRHDWNSRHGAPLETETAMVRLSAAPGLEPDQVVLGGVEAIDGRRIAVDKIHLRGVKLEQIPRDTTSILSPSQLWIEGCMADGGGLTSLHNIPSASQWQIGLYITDTNIRNARVGVKTEARLVRGVSVATIGEDAFTNVPMILNSTAEELLKGAPEYHADVVQYLGEQENTIVYGLQAVDQQAQTIFSRGTERHDNAAFVNVMIEGGHGGTGAMGQWIRTSNHVLFWNMTMVGATYSFRSLDPRGDQRHVANLSIQNSIFDTVHYPDEGYPEPDLAFKNNHFLHSESLGLAATSGGSYGGIFMNPASNDFTPRSGELLDNRVDWPLLPADARNNRVHSGGAVGAIQPSRRSASGS